MRATEANLIFKTKKNETLNFAFSSRYKNRNVFNVKKKEKIGYFCLLCFKNSFSNFHLTSNVYIYRIEKYLIIIENKNKTKRKNCITTNNSNIVCLLVKKI